MVGESRTTIWNKRAVPHLHASFTWPYLFFGLENTPSSFFIWTLSTYPLGPSLADTYQGSPLILCLVELPVVCASTTHVFSGVTLNSQL